LEKGGRVLCWGYNRLGDLGVGDAFEYKPVPVRLRP
jgi:hypothetical protein